MGSAQLKLKAGELCPPWTLIAWQQGKTGLRSLHLKCSKLTIGEFILHRFHASKDSVSIIPELIHTKYACPLMKALWIKAEHHSTGKVPTCLVWVAPEMCFAQKRPLNNRYYYIKQQNVLIQKAVIER